VRATNSRDASNFTSRRILTLQRQFPTIARRPGELARSSFRSQKNRKSGPGRGRFNSPVSPFSLLPPVQKTEGGGANGEGQTRNSLVDFRSLPREQARLWQKCLASRQTPHARRVRSASLLNHSGLAQPERPEREGFRTNTARSSKPGGARNCCGRPKFHHRSGSNRTSRC